MKSMWIVLALSATVGAGNAAAATDQQNKMSTCNAEAKTKELKGDERKKFMSECLSAKPAADAASAPETGTAQQNKMKTCNAEAKTKDLKGDERKKFMSECLKAKP